MSDEGGAAATRLAGGSSLPCGRVLNGDAQNFSAFRQAHTLGHERMSISMKLHARKHAADLAGHARHRPDMSTEYGG
jgi:hypothetical protein